VLLQNGEREGLVITLMSVKHKVFIDFGVVSAIRMLDEGIALNDLFNDEQTKVFRSKGFDNTIYQITNGKFEDFIKKTGGELIDFLNIKHYVIISLNFIIEIITEWEPDIVVVKNE